ncbi:thymidylate synthase [Stenotrophomonas phage StenR_269]|nr:thymidylate synthase [Stenotrophomonas phage StenR_269]
MQVELVDHMGTDLSVVNAARVSFAKESKEFSSNDERLINYLAREKHVLPFRHPQITLRCKAPIFLARQLGKHQVGLSWSEESRRYIDSEPEFFWPDKWRKRAENVKQGSSNEEVELDDYLSIGGEKLGLEKVKFVGLGSLRDEIANTHNKSLRLYNNLLEVGVAPELARMILPQNMYVNWVWTGSLLSFFEMYKLRSEAHAQLEAQDFAAEIKRVIHPLYPVSWKALEENS